MYFLFLVWWVPSSSSSSFSTLTGIETEEVEGTKLFAFLSTILVAVFSQEYQLLLSVASQNLLFLPKKLFNFYLTCIFT